MNTRPKPDDWWSTWAWWGAGAGLVIFAIYSAHWSAQQAVDEKLRPFNEAIDDITRQRANQRLPAPGSFKDSRSFAKALNDLNEEMRLRAEQEQLSKRQLADRLTPDPLFQGLAEAQRQSEIAAAQERRYRQQVEYQQQMLESQRAILQELKSRQRKQWPYDH